MPARRKEIIMADKKAFLVLADDLDLNASGEALEQLKKKAVLLPNADTKGLDGLAEKLGGVNVSADAAAMKAAVEGEKVLAVAHGAAALAPALEAADRRTVIMVATAHGAAVYGMAVNSKAGRVDRTVNAQDLAVTLATIADLPIDETCTGAIIYQALKNPNLKLDEIKKLQDAIARMESILERNNREPWEKHDCA